MSDKDTAQHYGSVPAAWSPFGRSNNPFNIAGQGAQLSGTGLKLFYWMGAMFT